MSNSASSFAAAGVQAPSGPWWRHPMMWLVVGGPSLVVVASFITLALAINHADPVVRHGAETGSAQASADDPDNSGHTGHPATATHAAAEAVVDPALQPAMRARNHAATGGEH